MSYSWQDLCTILSESIPEIPFKWTSHWVESGDTSISHTTGNLWGKVLTFNDRNIYSAPRPIVDLVREEMVTKASIKKRISGPILVITTRFDYE